MTVRLTVRTRPADDALTVTVYVRGGGGGVLPAPPLHPLQSCAHRKRAASASPGRNRSCIRPPFASPQRTVAPRSSRAPTHARTGVSRLVGDIFGGVLRSGIHARVVVATLTVTLLGTATDAGTVQLTSADDVLQLSPTVPEKPFTEARLSVKVVDPPGFRVALVGFPGAAPILKSAPFPERATVWGLPAALLVIESDPM